MVIDPAVPQVAALLAQRNAIDRELAGVIGRPPTTGALGEFIASRIFDIELEASATAKGIDGRFRSGPLAGDTVDVKCYGKREGLLDLPTHDTVPDWHLVLTGPLAQAASSRGQTRPWVIDAVYLFPTRSLLVDLRARGLAIGVATSVARAVWDKAELYPHPTNPSLTLSPAQTTALALFSVEQSLHERASADR